MLLFKALECRSLPPPPPGLPGGFSPTRRATEEIQKIADEVKLDVKTQLGNQMKMYEAVVYTSQVVAGFNYIILMQINEDLFTTIDVLKPLFGKSDFRGFVGPFDKVVGPIEPFSTVKPDIKPFTPTNPFGPVIEPVDDFGPFGPPFEPGPVIKPFGQFGFWPYVKPLPYIQGN